MDSLGHPTVGVGFNLDRYDAKHILGDSYEDVCEGRLPLSEAKIKQLLSSDIQTAMHGVVSVIHEFSGLSLNRKVAMVDMCFNLGLSRFSRFKNMIAAMNQFDWNTAADEAEDSVWFHQVGRRGRRVVSLIREG